MRTSRASCSIVGAGSRDSRNRSRARHRRRKPSCLKSMALPSSHRIPAMALTPGTRLGRYEITAQIGVGGMGEVYRATDTTLKRAVAIKVIAGGLSSDPERLARLQRA